MNKIPLTYDTLIKQHLSILKDLQYKSGLFAASSKSVGTGYEKSWLRDNFYESLAFIIIGDWETVEHTYDALLKIFIKHEYKIDHAISQKPDATHEYIHARFSPETFDEYWEEWGNKQNDSVGAILYMVGELEHHHNKSILDTPDKVRIVQKLVHYLDSLEYWHDKDSGMWEEDEEVHSSSVGACVAGLKSVSRLPRIQVPAELIEKGEESLKTLLPRESKRKFVDLSLLSLIYPYNVVSDDQRSDILENVEYHLLKEKGVIRYKGDMYYNKNKDGFSEEAEWTFGLSWLALIYTQIGNKSKAESFLRKTIRTDTEKGIPELFFSNTSNFNDNTPLGWSESLFVVALHEVNMKFGKSSDSSESETNKEYIESYTSSTD